MDHLVEILVPLGGMALTFGIVYFAITTNHKERLRLIESGADPQLFYSRGNRKGRAVRFGCLLIGVGLGALLGNILGNADLLATKVAVPSLILIFGGTGLLIGNYFANKMQDEDDRKSQQ